MTELANVIPITNRVVLSDTNLQSNTHAHNHHAQAQKHTNMQQMALVMGLDHMTRHRARWNRHAWHIQR